MKALLFALLVLMCAACGDSYYYTLEGAGGCDGGEVHAGGEGDGGTPTIVGCGSDADCGPCGMCTAVADCQPRIGLCRPRAGACDLAEYCDGVSLECPADEVQPYGALPEHPGIPDPYWCGRYACDGVGSQCPAMCSDDDGCAPGYFCNARGGCEATP